MGTRTVRLDQKTEKELDEIVRRTGRTASAVLKKGIHDQHGQLERPTAWEIYSKMDLGPGGYAIAPADQAKTAVREAIRRKHNR